MSKFNDSNWNNWKWQQKNTIDSFKDLKKEFPNLSFDIISEVKKHERFVRFKLTPYLLSLIEDVNGAPVLSDPILNQFVPFSSNDSAVSTNELKENWELPEDLVTPILQHKYKNRVLFRIQNTCLSYCMYCFEAKRTLEKKSNKEPYRTDHFKNSINYIENNPEIEEVILSGGEPLVLPNDKLKYILDEVKNIEHVQSIRIHTRVTTHNPFRVNDGFVDLISDEKVSCINIHVVHPNEITDEFKEAVKKLHRAGVLILAHTPLLKGINNNSDILKDLFGKLFQLGVKPYYLLHAMPETILADKYRTTVLEGVDLIKELKRFYSNPSIPEYIIVHDSGKKTVPLESSSTNEFKYENGKIKFRNWKGQWSIYIDGNL